MKTVLCNTKRFLATFLALALIVLSLPSSALTVQAAENDRYDVVSSDETGTVVTKSENGALTENAAGQLVSSDDTVVYDAGAWSVSTATNEPTGDTQTGSGTDDGTTDDTQEPASTGNGFTDLNLLGGTVSQVGLYFPTASEVTGVSDIKVYTVSGDAATLVTGSPAAYKVADTFAVSVKYDAGYENEKLSYIVDDDLTQTGTEITEATDTSSAAAALKADKEAGYSVFILDEAITSLSKNVHIVATAKLQEFEVAVKATKAEPPVLTPAADEAELKVTANGVATEGTLKAVYGKTVTFTLTPKDALTEANKTLINVRYFLGTQDNMLAAAAEWTAATPVTGSANTYQIPGTALQV